MRAIKIDTKTETVYEVWFNGTLDAIYKFIGCKTFTTVPVFYGKGVALYVDDEGLFNRGKGAFRIADYPEALSGNGLIVGINDIGEDVTCTVPLETITKLVRFVDESELLDIH